MRRLDAIARVSRPLAVRDRRGEIRHLYGLQRVAARMGDCPQRYVLNQSATEQCRQLMMFAQEMFLPSDPFLRVPAEQFWLEWFCDAEEGLRIPDNSPAVQLSHERMGALVSADPSGRRGKIQHFFSGSDGPVMAQTSLLFDFDRELVKPKGSQSLFRLTHADLDHLNPLFRHTLMKLDPDWEDIMKAWRPEEIRRTSFAFGQEAWCCLPIVLAFSAMLNSGGILDERRPDLVRLNKSRAKAKRPSLLDHVEVGMQLGYSRYSEGVSKLNTERQTPRLHFVRGHIVRRSGQTFWRTSHLRGDAARPVGSRTVRFNAVVSDRQEGTPPNSRS